MSTIIVQAFGRLSRDPNLPGIIDDEEEDLYSVFRARSELMCWSTTLLPRPQRLLAWGMEEAELTAGTEGSMIGEVQVGLHSHSPEVAMVLPALIQCFYDALRRFGAVELSALQVTAMFLDPSPRPRASDLNSAKNWFNTTLKARENALISFDQEFLAGRTDAELLPRSPLKYSSLEFGPVAAVPEQHSIKAPDSGCYSFFPAHSGISVKLPEWTADTAAWVLATVTDWSLAKLPDITRFAIRITRVP